jgi:hypothetical protein
MINLSTFRRNVVPSTRTKNSCYKFFQNAGNFYHFHTSQYSRCFASSIQAQGYGIYERCIYSYMCVCVCVYKYKQKAKQSSPATRHGGAWGKRRYGSYSFLASALDGDEWSASRPGRALPRGKDPRYPLCRKLGGPKSRSGHRGYRKIICPCRGSNPDCLFVQSIVRQYTD